jgi:hypothetical protein
MGHRPSSRPAAAPIRLVVAVGVLVVVLVCGGCSGGDDAGSASASASGRSLRQPLQRPTKADFVRQANDVCRELDQQLAADGDQLGEDASLDELVAVYRDNALPAFRGAMDRIVALGFPTEDDAALRTLFSDVYAAIDRVAADPEKQLMASSDPFESVNQRLTDYGLDSCAP